MSSDSRHRKRPSLWGFGREWVLPFSTISISWGRDSILPEISAWRTGSVASLEMMASLCHHFHSVPGMEHGTDSEHSWCLGLS